MYRRLLILCMLTAGMPLQVLAHHSWSAFFILDERITVEGVVVEFLPQNPHGYIVLDAAGESGEIERWRAEMPAWVGMKRNRGWETDDLKPGDRVRITGAPSRFDDRTLIRADDIVMPDGWTRHLFNDPETGRMRPATPPAGVDTPSESIAGTAPIELRSDGGWPGLGIAWKPNRGTSSHPLDQPAPAFDFREAPFTEAGSAAWDAQRPLDDPGLECEAPIFLVSMNATSPIMVREEAGHLRIYGEHWDLERTIYMDRRQPPADLQHSTMGFSRGYYDGDELVIETTHLAGGYALRVGGPPYSDRLNVTERYVVRAEGPTLEITFIIDDPEMFSQAISWQRHFRPADMQEIQPFDCQPDP